MSPPAATLRSRARSLAVWVLVGAMAAAAVAVLAALPASAPRSRIDIPWWVLAAAFIVTERCLVHVHFRRSSHALTLGELPLVVALAFDSPVKIAVAWAAALLVVLVPGRPQPVRLAYNVANVWLITAIVATVIDALPSRGAALWAGMVTGALAASVVTALALAAVMALSGEQMGPARVRTMVATGCVVSATNACLALAAIVVLDADPAAGVLLIAPMATVYVAYRAYTKQRRQHLELGFLYDASRTLTRAADSAAGLAGVLAMSLETFHAEIAEVCMLSAQDDEDATRITVGPDDRVDVLEPVPAALALAWRDLVAGDRGAQLLAGPGLEAGLGERLAALGLREALIAPLTGDDGVIGTMLVANRGGVSRFGPADRRLLETLAGHTGAALGNDRLERRVVALHETKQQLYHQAFHDPLTGLANRLLFSDRVEHALARRTGNVIVIYVDLDDFKPVNDTYGHEAGDLLLCAVGERLRDSLRPVDTPARLGGDEFAVLLTDVAPDDVRVVADRILGNFGAPVELGDGVATTISASMGIAIGDSGAMTGEELLRNADAAMYVAKRGGKSGYAINDQDVPAAA